MSVKRYPFGKMPNGQSVERYELKSGRLTVSVLTYGATVQSIVFDGKDVVLGYDDLEHYLTGGSYFGATVGRVANRIGGAQFTVNGRTSEVAKNDREDNHLHGGVRGFDRHIWTAEILSDEDGVRMRRLSPDGEEGYPGNLKVTVTFTVSGGRLRIAYTAVSDADTPLNLTNHSYFNLEGHDGSAILDTTLQIAADAILVPDEKLIPTGELLPVEGTPFDLREAKRLGDGIGSAHPLIVAENGYDHNFVLGTEREWKCAAVATAAESGIRMECWTDLPGVQLYTANGLDEACCKGGARQTQYRGFCLETQFWPDAVNREEFPGGVLRAGDLFRSKTEYRFSKV